MPDKDSKKIEKVLIDPKTAYDLSKLISDSKTISDELIASMVISMFIDYLSTYTDPKAAAIEALKLFKKSIYNNKLDEIKSLDGSASSVSDMLFISEIINSEDLKNYKTSLDDVFDTYENLILTQLESYGDDEGIDDEDS